MELGGSLPKDDEMELITERQREEMDKMME